MNLCNQLGCKGLEKTRKRPGGYSLVFPNLFRSNALQIFFALISRIQAKIKTGSIFLVLGFLFLAQSVCLAVTGKFVFAVNPIVTGDSGDEKEELRKTIVASWQAYLRMDTQGYLDHFTQDAIRLSERAGERQAGRPAIQAGMTAEWDALERPKNLIAEKMTVERADFHIEGNFATAIYWMNIKGGERWHYSDQALVFQAFVRRGKEWLVAHHTEAWSLDYDVESQKPGQGTKFDFDFSYPVKDLDRAVKFYTPLLGSPEYVTSTTACFNLKGGRFILETSSWGGMAKVRKNLPNGYALFLVADVEKEAARLRKAEIPSVGNLQKIGPDIYCVILDSDENMLVLKEKNFKAAADAVPEVKGFPSASLLSDKAQKVMQSWLSMDADTFTTVYSPHGTWFDNTRIRNRGQERGSKIVSALKSYYWPRYDHGARGMAARLEAANFHERELGGQRIVSYDLHLTGQGAHPFRDSAWVTQVFDKENQPVHTFIVDNNHSKAPVLELDYTGYPVKDVEKARQFYAKTMQLGEGYEDEGYYGFWSNRAVFGLYEAEPEEDHLPQPQQANGYMSFWVRSAKETHRYLKENGCTFPVIPAINSKSGIDKQPGYTQVVTTDSEGSVILFTEYSGRPR